ncbi:MAG TPA: hypothetical protein VIX91_13985, partial [Candidatus Acidoferrum sp.]
NLYIPSTVRWTQDGAQVSLTQKSVYPFDSHIEFQLQSSPQRDFTLNFRIPSWAEGASLSVNGKRIQDSPVPGSFAAVRREWKTGDHMDLDLPLTKRLEPIDPRHANTVALLAGPLVLFSVGESSSAVARQQLLSATKTGRSSWQAGSAATPLTLLPFTAIADEQYSTYLLVS